MSLVEKEAEYLKDERFLKVKPTTMYSTPYRLQYFHNSTDGPHSKTAVYLHYYFDTNVVHMAPKNVFSSLYYQLDSLIEYHPHICVAEEYGALILSSLLNSNKYDGNTIMLNPPLATLLPKIPATGNHRMVLTSFHDKALLNKLLNYIPGEEQVTTTEQYEKISKKNLVVYILQEGYSLDSLLSEESGESCCDNLTLKQIVEGIFDPKLEFSKKQDKGMLWYNALIVTFLILIAFIKVLLNKKDNKKENKEKKD